jgi:hypothetical protein
MKVQNVIRTIGFAAAFAIAGLANAAVFTVDAKVNSIAGGEALDTGITLQAGQHLSISVDPTLTWNFSFGAPGYDTNANGATGWGMGVQNPDGSGFTANIGELVGQIGTGTADAGNFFIVGTSFDGYANKSGKLNLFYWDSDAWNNVGAVAADVQVPEPASMALFGLGLLALARFRRRA